MKNYKMFTKFLTLILTLSATYAFAIPKEPCYQSEACCERPEPGPFAFTYPKDDGLICPRGFHIFAEFLWMKASEEGLDFATSSERSGDSIFYPINAKFYGFSTGSNEWDWRPGFKVGVSHTTNHDDWNFEALWTYIRIKADADAENTNNHLIPFWFYYEGDIISMKHASARWSGDYNTLDINLKKPVHFSRYFIANPYFGFRLAWIDQDYHARYFPIDQNANAFCKNDFRGVGPRGGFDGEFILAPNWSLYGKSCFSLLFGKFDISEIGNNAPNTARNYSLEDSFYNAQPNMDISLGITYNNFFNKNRYKIAVNLGYNFIYWWSQNQLMPLGKAIGTAIALSKEKGALSFNGFSGGLNIDF